MGVAVAVTPGAGFSGATAVFPGGDFPSAADQVGVVTFTTATTIPASPYLMFTLAWAGSWNSTYADAVVFVVVPCTEASLGRSAAFMAAVAALGPFYCIPNAANTQLAVYCTNAPAISTAYDIGFLAFQGP